MQGSAPRDGGRGSPSSVQQGVLASAWTADFCTHASC